MLALQPIMGGHSQLGNHAMDHTGEYKLGIQIGQRGFYAHVWLIVSPNPSSDSLKVEFAHGFLGDKYCPKESFQAAMGNWNRFWLGKEYAAFDPSIGGLCVREVNLHYMVMDSTAKCVAYAAAGALLNALGLERLLPPFQPEIEL